MIREHSVGIEELTALNIGTERSENIGRIEAADTVACVNDNLEAFKRLVIVLGINALLYHLSQMQAIGFHVVIINAKRRFCSVFLAVDFLRRFEKLGDVFTLKSAVRGEKFKAVSLPRVMACRYLNCTVAFKVKRRHEHGRS